MLNFNSQKNFSRNFNILEGHQAKDVGLNFTSTKFSHIHFGVVQEIVLQNNESNYLIVGQRYD